MTHAFYFFEKSIQKIISTGSQNDIHYPLGNWSHKFSLPYAINVMFNFVSKADSAPILYRTHPLLSTKGQ